MKKTLSSALLLALLLPVGQVFANSDFDDVRYGEHPYDVRRDALESKKQRAEERRSHPRFFANDPLYYHPSVTKIGALHPYYRYGGISVGQGYAEWRGYLPPHALSALNTVTHCMNFRYQVPSNRSMPFGYECLQ